MSARPSRQETARPSAESYRDQPDIRFNRLSVEGSELEYVAESVANNHMSSGGPFTARAQELLREETGAAGVLLTTSCTSALELSGMLVDLGPGDTVVVPSFTFTSTALAFARQGAGLLFCDIEPTTLGMDPEHLASLLDDTVRAVVIVHYAGIACDVDGIRRVLSDRPDVVLIEDNAHGLFGRLNGQPLGSLGRFGTLSFHETKNFGCGEGGALILNDARDMDRAQVLYDKGTNRAAFFLGEVDKYSWKDTGGSFGMADTLAAYLLGQLERSAAIQAKRRSVFEEYQRQLSPHAEELGFRLPAIPEGRDPAWHLFYVLLPDPVVRDATLAGMRGHGVRATFHYVPLHTADAGVRFAVRPTECPVTDDVSGRLLRLPFYNSLSRGDIERVVSAFLATLAS